MVKEIFDHVSVREYADKEIPEDVLNKVLNAASRASNTGNMQIYSIIVNTDMEMIAKLAPTHFCQPAITNAKAVLTFCADINRFKIWCKNRNAEAGFDNFLTFMTAATDAIIAAQNACLEAESNGLGICYLGTVIYNADKIIEILKLPKGVVPVATVTMGYPKQQLPLTERLPLEAIVHRETYHDFSSADIDRIYATTESLESNKKFVAENNKQTLAQVFTDVRYTKAGNEQASKCLLDVLKKQGFMQNE
ncbi:MAG: nitroreductase family protein [Bacteroidales bacterium]|nr:nitroreductase family protein [Bacteroidales bacterium]